jgi:uncharacterized membrane protein YdfJ with MMPL/SSD domain
MRSVARWCVRHRLAVLAAWIVVLAAAFFGQSATGFNYSAGAAVRHPERASRQPLAARRPVGLR